MKFQKLTIHHIASIEDAVIDFEAAPLCDSEVFLITGKTGAGKSTILDAICLALYADTPRLYSTKMQGVTMDADKEVKIDDPRQLMRRNTTEAFVSLTFIGSNDVHYESTWSVARSYNKISRSIKSKTWELKNLDTDSTLTRDTEIKNEIHAAVGLDFSQFCRTTMLAQGEFTRFLNSKDDEKAEILEKITGVDVYSKIGAKVCELTGKRKQEWDDARRLVEGARTLTEEEIVEKKDTIIALEAEGKELKNLSNKSNEKIQWLTTEAGLEKEITDAAESLYKANEIIASDEFKQKGKLVKEWNDSIEARGWLTVIKKADLSMEEQNRTLDSLKNDFTILLGGYAFAEQDLVNIGNELNELDTSLNQEKDKATIYENVQTICGFLTTIADGRLSIAQSNNGINQENSSLTDVLTPAFEKAKCATVAAKESFKKHEMAVKAQEKSVTQLNLPELRTQRETSKDLLAKIKTAKERLDTLYWEKNRMEGISKNLSERLSAIEEKRKSSLAMDVPIHDAETTMNVRKEDLDNQRDTIDNFAKALRIKLHIGDICPVCRQTIKTELPHEEELSLLVSGLKEDYEKAEKEYRKLVNVKVNLEAEIKSESAFYNRDKKAFEKDQSVENAKQKAIYACNGCGIEKIDDTTLSSLDNLDTASTALNEKLEAKIKEGESKENGVKKLRADLDAKRDEVDALAGKFQDAEKKIDDCKGRIVTLETLVKSKDQVIKTAEENVNALIMIDTWDINWNEYPKEFAAALKASAKKYNVNLQKKQMLTGKYETAKTNSKNVSGVIDSILKSMPQWKGVKPTETDKIENLLDKANHINTTVVMALTQLKAAKDTIETNRPLLDSFLAEHELLNTDRLTALNHYTSKKISDVDYLLDKERKNIVVKKTLLESANKQHQAHQEKKPDLTAEDTLEFLDRHMTDLEKQLGEIGEKKGTIHQELKIDEENKQKLGMLMKEAEDKSVVYNKWSRLNQLIGNSTGSTFRKIAQSYVLTSLIHSANSYMKTLSDRYTLKVSPGTFVISLEDAYQGYVSRAASTISGGESFLVSLSLALALSDIGQQWQVDTLFIDEGFGTLSGEPLQKAIDTLRSVHSKSGRHVGIISHVEELQERIPVQIQVNQEGNNSSSKIKIVRLC